MALRLNADGKLLYRPFPYNKLVYDEDFNQPGICCCHPFILVYNSNGGATAEEGGSGFGIDDNFHATLNGNLLGDGIVNNDVPGVTGTLFTGGPFGGKFVWGSFFYPYPPPSAGLTRQVQFDPALLVDGANTLRLTSIQDNNNSNQGSVLIGRMYSVENAAVGQGSNWHVMTSFLNDSYSFLDGVGQFQDFEFNYVPL